MIRRPITRTDGTPCWALIPQTEHARLAGVLAEHWLSAPLVTLVSRDQWLPAIFHHDDGWESWEQLPDVCPETGRPLDFTEMPLAISLEIWLDSVTQAATIGPLAAYMVSGHFCRLLRRFSDRWRGGPPSDTALALKFLDEQDRRQARWLSTWQSGAAAARDSHAAELAVEYLQFFDAVSLWLCCQPRQEVQQFDLPHGGSMRFLPARPQEISVVPWPFSTLELQLTVTARIVPAIPYQDRQALAEAPDESGTVTWRIQAMA